MTDLMNQLLHLFCCPDDGGELLRDSAAALRCVTCSREFPVSNDGRRVSLVSRRMANLEDSASSYAAAYCVARSMKSDSNFWRMQSGPKNYLRKQSMVELVERMLIENGSRDVVCDFSAGPGYYTLNYATHWQHVIHCDLSECALDQAWDEATRRGLRNVLFVRMDYLNPPFKSTLEKAICMDSLLRGPGHEKALLAAIRNSMAPGGAAVVDFHNWWHNPLRRLGLMRQNLSDNRSYGFYELPPLLASAGITRYERVAFYQELVEMPSGIGRSLAEMLLPPTRWMFRFNS